MSKRRIAIVTGGNSSEKEISVKSAQQLSEMIDHQLFDVDIISIKGKEWKGVSSDIKDLAVNKADFSIQKGNSEIRYDCVYISIHGTPGEDGILQSYFELIEMPYTSSGVFCSSLTFNKYASKIFLKEFNVRTAKTLRFNKKDEINPNQIINELGLPCFVKPNESGSSFGVSKIHSMAEFDEAIEKAFKEDDEILFEEFISGTELTCGVIKTEEKVIVLPVTEIIPKTEFFDYDAKYKHLSEEITPARIPSEITKKCQQLSSLIYDAFGCSGIARVDYIYSRDELYFLEINTVPGMSSESIIPQQIRSIGMNPGDIFTLVINDAIKKVKKNK